ncbi:MAG: ABC transporter ATP-binding protein [Hyphomicrobiaceae bacterium]|nr:ABC transporter ATP-binding protein [Hyphomicrobiaceae bacterium]
MFKHHVASGDAALALASKRDARPKPLLAIEHLTKHFPLQGGLFGRPSGVVQAVDDVSFLVERGETLGIVGESGCGKSTTARLLMHLIKPDRGSIVFDGHTVGVPEGLSHRELHRQMQMVFQDSYASLNPRLPVAMSIAFGPFVHGLSKTKALLRAAELLEAVGLEPALFANRYPHELSGGQRQRINVARALALEPRIIILDEAVSALDKSVEAQVLNLLADLKVRFDLTYVFISHDLNVVRYISDRVMVMYLGKVVEIGPVDRVYRDPQHPYTRALLSAMPSMDPRRRTRQAPLSGDPPNPVRPPSGCRFRTRCPLAEAVCERAAPGLLAPPSDAARAVACHIYVPASGHSRAAVAMTE